jgi:hypothetical protein
MEIDPLGNKGSSLDRAIPPLAAVRTGQREARTFFIAAQRSTLCACWQKHNAT